MGKQEKKRKKKSHSKCATYDWSNVASDKLKNKIMLPCWLYGCEDIYIFDLPNHLTP